MNCRKLDAYRNGLLSIDEMFMFIHGEHAMLLNHQNGVSLFVDREIAERIQQRDLDENIIFLLVQRGMARYDESRRVVPVAHPSIPTFFLLDLTHGCNLRCQYCFRELESSVNCMSDDMLEKICVELSAYWKRHPEIRLTIQGWGGEPMTRMDQLHSIRKYFREQDLDPEIVIETNGTLMSEANIKLLKEDGVKIGISIDGFPEIQNEQRPDVGGNGTCEKIEKGIELLRKEGIDQFGTITVVTQNTYRNLNEILDYFIRKLCLTSIKFNPLRKTGKADELGMMPQEMADFACMLLEQMKNLHRQGYSCIEQNIAQRIRNLTCRACDNICSAYGCQGGYAMLSIDMDGKVYPCEMSDFPDMALGQIMQEPIEVMLKQAVENKNVYFAARNEQNDRCRECPWVFYCRGGCKAAAQFACGNMNTIDEMECAYNRAMYPLLTELLLEEPEMAYSLMRMDR